jgi:spore coat protein CotF
MEALNDLNFYTVQYKIKLTKEIKKMLDESWDTGVDVITDLGIYAAGEDSNTKICIKKYSALTDEQANSKITEWLDKQVENQVISDYELLSRETNTLYDVLKEKELLPLVNEEAFEEVRRKSM